MFKADADLAVIGEAASFEETLKLVDVLKPDIVLLDLYMPDERITCREIWRWRCSKRQVVF
jgi:DNA-binding NarL/FixJ family response regulator